MKKILALIVVLALVFVALPLIGNKLVDDTLKDRMEVLTSYGVEISVESEEKGYFKTKKHYELLLQDTEKFMKYLENFSDAQFPPYTNAMIKGVKIGIDLEYSNFPVSDKISIDIYPMKLSQDMMNDLAAGDAKFRTYIDTLLEHKTILYHINYAVVNKEFDGYVKDFDEKFTQDKTDVRLVLQGAKFNGEGLVMAPELLESTVSNLKIYVTNSKETLKLAVNNFHSTATFETQSTYATGMSLESLELISKNSREQTEIKALNTHLNVSSNTQDPKAEFYVKSSSSSFSLASQKEKIELKDFNYDISLNGIDKAGYEEFRVLVAKAKSGATSTLQQQMQNSLLNILSQGLSVDIADFSVKDISIANNGLMKGFSTKSKIVLKQDLDLKKNPKMLGLRFVNNLEIESHFSISKSFMKFLNQQVPASTLSLNYAKDEGENYIFDLKFKNSKLKINDKNI